LNKILAILLSLALYAPCITNIALYIECIVSAKTYADKEACGCNITTTDGNKDAHATVPDKLKANSFKTDWQLLNNPQFSCNNNGCIIQSKWLFTFNVNYLKGYNSSVFRPPSI
jgi:hypothetical protein